MTDQVSTPEFPELSCYLLPGHTTTPADAISEAKTAERLGLGKVWVSERFDVKEAGVICSAALAVTESLQVATAATNLHTRHPLTLASMCSSLHYLSAGRFTLGLSRGVAIRNQLMGLENVGNKQMTEGLEILRTLWRGEKVMGYDGPMGNLPYLSTGDWMAADIPIYFVGFGERSLEFAGQHFDGAHLHTFITPAGIAKANARIGAGAAKQGRQRSDLKVCSVLATVLEPSEEDRLRKLVARMATYMQAPGYAELLVQINDWDIKVLEDFRASSVVSNIAGGIDSVATLEQLEEIAKLIPSEWLEPAAVGRAEQCARRIKAELDLGVEEVCLHGSTAAELEPIIDAYRQLKAG